MLGGPVYISIIRILVSMAGTILLFSLMDEPRFGRVKTFVIYGISCLAVLPLTCIWYTANRPSFIRLAPISLFTFISLISIFLSSTRIYLTLYKLAFTFYLMGFFVIGGIEISLIFFDGNVWADILARIILVMIIAFGINKYLRDLLRGFGIYLEKELDQFSIIVLIISLFLGIIFVLSPYSEEEMKYRLLRITVNFFMVGTLQVMVFRLYLHIGRESEYRTENQMFQMNHRLLERQMEFLEESVESGRRIRHDARHHNMVIAEYARRRQIKELLEYLGQYERDTEEGTATVLCENIAVNNILSAYTRKAKREQIKVLLDVEVEKECGIQDIDLVTVLSNAYENAIYGCVEARKQSPARECIINLLVKRKKNKLVIYCSNTCKMETSFKNGYPKPEFTGGIGVSSIVKTAKTYGGEPDFRNDEGVFIFRLIMNIPGK